MLLNVEVDFLSRLGQDEYVQASRQCFLFSVFVIFHVFLIHSDNLEQESITEDYQESMQQVLRSRGSRARVSSGERERPSHLSGLSTQVLGKALQA